MKFLQQNKTKIYFDLPKIANDKKVGDIQGNISWVKVVDDQDNKSVVNMV